MRTLVSVFFLVNSIFASDVTQHPNWHLLDHEQCGESLSDRIVGGTEAALGQYPWMALLGFRDKTGNDDVIFSCGGSLINKLYILTAAHCLAELESKNDLVKIRLGEHDKDKTVDCQGSACAPPVQDIKPLKWIIHESYDTPQPIWNDIGLIRLKSPATITDYVRPICLPYGSLLEKNYDNATLEVTGFGVTDIKKPALSKVLMSVKVPIMMKKLCEKYWKNETELNDGQICAGGNVGYDSCAGDSGGPLMKADIIDGPPKYFLIGLVSYGLECGAAVPAIYTDVRKYGKWILDKMEP